MRKKRKTKGEREEKTGETNKREKRKTKRVLKYPRSAVTSLSPPDHILIPYARDEPYARVQDPATPPPFGETGLSSFTLQKVFANYSAIFVRVSVVVVPFGVKVSS